LSQPPPARDPPQCFQRRDALSIPIYLQVGRGGCLQRGRASWLDPYCSVFDSIFQANKIIHSLRGLIYKPEKEAIKM
jgi:hypothetical protein